ncbi:MAG: hypothetical protein M5R36_27195 [Deltaproteobacteria bacterium]|nr:hypothetical protein [Deltaproteobacteria bacterium]
MDDDDAVDDDDTASDDDDTAADDDTEEIDDSAPGDNLESAQTSDDIGGCSCGC